ncbi:hypothetical protein [Simiduia agarivorans]|uniref:3-hydroxylacyl-ACP dehydratase n=1 Tax=Simiduia agarivorans (strain DSM 21679 / JCM 13881 / BCRC 17597 / SA1) TaxID=1117647 RepID=K4KHI8_SIMAS|nr:hypothetical protein [Simiduia agarivorans]AFU98579.1 hypothetical protein M5M_06920 [Simiduia agarivorans SA1 = DSM 21679]
MIRDEMMADIGGTASPWPVLQLVPHDQPMSLLQQVLTVSDKGLVAGVSIESDSPFYESDGVPALVAIEYMAQAVAAYAGHLALSAGGKVELGFLVGTRKYRSNVAFFASGTQLTVCVKPLLKGDNGLSVFDCRVAAEGIEVSANLNVFEPEDPAAFLAAGN